MSLNNSQSEYGGLNLMHKYVVSLLPLYFTIDKLKESIGMSHMVTEVI